MRVHVAFITPDHEEPSYGLDFDMPSVPAPGDVITIQRAGQEGASQFVVRRRAWHLDSAPCGPAPVANRGFVGNASSATIECEFVAGSFSSEEHKRVAEA